MSIGSSRFLLSTAAALTVAALLPAIGCNANPTVTAAPVSASTATPSPAPAAPVPVATPAAETTTAARPFTTTGPLVAEQQADIAAERDGLIVKIAVQIGDRVQKGQLLALLDDRALHAACDAQKARVTSLEAQVAEWQAEQRTEEADLRRADIMRKENIRSEEDWEHVKYKLDETIQEVARYRADQTVAEAELRSANLQLEQSRIVAPFAGVVGRGTVRLDQQVKKGDVLFWITAEAPLRVLFTVPESVMGSFTTGTTLELTTTDYPDLRQAARILRVSPVVDPASGSVQVIGAVEHPSKLLKPGMSMQVQLAQGQLQLMQGQVRPAP
jgi:membrane fusion protein, multidrug efflux system